MGLMQKAVETYDSHLKYASKEREGQAMLAPVGHIITRADIVVTLDQDGCFVDAISVDKKAPKIIIPATESSAGRTSAPCAHPLCEQIGYLIPTNEKKYELYIRQLKAWKESTYTHPKLTPILNYVEKGTLLSDLVRCGLMTLNEQGGPENEKMMVCWRVLGELQEACWLDESLFASFTGYYLYTQNNNADALCMVTGTLGLLRHSTLRVLCRLMAMPN